MSQAVFTFSLDSDPADVEFKQYEEKKGAFEKLLEDKKWGKPQRTANPVHQAGAVLESHPPNADHDAISHLEHRDNIWAKNQVRQ